MITQKLYIGLMTKGKEPILKRRYTLFKISGAQYRVVLGFKDSIFECDCSENNAGKIGEMWNENKEIYQSKEVINV